MGRHLATRSESRQFNSRRSSIIFRATMTLIHSDEPPVRWDREQTLVLMYVDLFRGISRR